MSAAKHTRRAWFIESRSGTRAPLLLDFTLSSTETGALHLLRDTWGAELANKALAAGKARVVRVELTWAAKAVKP